MAIYRERLRARNYWECRCQYLQWRFSAIAVYNRRIKFVLFVLFFGHASTSTIVSVQSGYLFQSFFGIKSLKKDFHCYPSRERKKGKKIYDFLSTMKSVTKMKKAIIPTKNKTDFVLAKFTVHPIHSCLFGGNSLLSCLL